MDPIQTGTFFLFQSNFESYLVFFKIQSFSFKRDFDSFFRGNYHFVFFVIFLEKCGNYCGFTFWVNS
ncbi:hypothetical protein LEP1GSC082_1123 [Leptospira kirschneri str. H2]|uniref:Uncharacterized protein n=1 Tax=Leptospira kirschneri str. H1 TaxID=1049966 RepID=A0A0E2AXU9_9LEPT|nr:hypothetical protein LEP1GSC081_2224 [Leptospira kirschneri str. H1]EKO59236.1 hypothetical protein LEP1GSC082_1123 [Leptospira kirschneri str. H2]